MNRLIQFLFTMTTALLVNPPSLWALDIVPAEFELGHHPLLLISMTGTINSDDVFKVEDFFTHHLEMNGAKRRTREARPVLIVLNSEGGRDLENFQDMAKALLEASDLHYIRFQRPLVLVFDRLCASGCTLLAAHLTRMRDPNNLVIIANGMGRFGFHAPSPYSKQGIQKFRDSKSRSLEIRKLLRAYVNAGVSKTWIFQNSGMLTKDLPTLIPASQLCRADVGILPADACQPGPEAALKAAGEYLTGKKEPGTSGSISPTLPITLGNYFQISPTAAVDYVKQILSLLVE